MRDLESNKGKTKKPHHIRRNMNVKTLEKGEEKYLRRAGAILLVRVPATIIQSDWRGLGLKMIPNRSIS